MGASPPKSPLRIASVGTEMKATGGEPWLTIRSAAKNHAHVAVVTSPEQYGPILEELSRTGALSAETRQRLALAAFQRTSQYDAAISAYLELQFGNPKSKRPEGTRNPKSPRFPWMWSFPGLGRRGGSIL